MSVRRFILISLLFFSCNEGKDGVEKAYYSNGILKSEKIPVKDSISQYTYIEFYLTGFVKSIQTLKNGSAVGQLLSFHENGMLQKKIIVDSNNSANGMAYWFYPNGVLKNIRNYRNQKEVGLGGDYWDKPYGIIQSAVLFNDSGQVIYKMSYDSNGNFINREGRKPDYWKGD